MIEVALFSPSPSIRTQCEIAQKATAGDFGCCSDTRYITCDFGMALQIGNGDTGPKQIGFTYSNPVLGPLPRLDVLRSQIAEGRPAVLNIDLGGDESHYVVVAGFTTNHLLILDPASRYGSFDDGFVPNAYYSTGVNSVYSNIHAILR